MIKIKKLSHSYSTQNHKELEVLRNINLNIDKGGFVVVLGESGCGKTTFLNLIAGHTMPTKGKIIINNEPVTKPHYSRSFIFQQPCLLPWLNVRDNITFGCKLRKEKKNFGQRTDKYIKLMGLESFEKTYPNDLSAGMAQRAAFARSLVGQPELLLLDEPFTSLDFINRKRLQSELIRSWLFEKFTVIFVTHDIDEALLLGNKIVLLSMRPAKIKEVYSIEEKYPRDLTSGKLFNLKSEIQKNFENINNIF